MTEMGDKYLTLKDLSKYCSMPVPTIRDYLHRDGLPHYRLRGKILVKLSEFDDWIKQYRVAGESLEEHVNAALKGLKLT